MAGRKALAMSLYVIAFWVSFYESFQCIVSFPVPSSS